jgi:hypothetical protein
MIKKRMTIGNSLGIIIEQPIRELLAMENDTPLEVTTNGTGLMLRPVRPSDPAPPAAPLGASTPAGIPQGKTAKAAHTGARPPSYFTTN